MKNQIGKVRLINKAFDRRSDIIKWDNGKGPGDFTLKVKKYKQKGE